MDRPDCNRTRALIDAAIDGELDAANLVSVEDHLAGCAECRAIHAERQALSHRIKTDAPRFTAPTGLRGRVLAGLPSEAPPSQIPWLTFGGWSASALALAASLALFVTTPGPQDQLAHDLIEAHLRSLMAEHLTDVPSSDRHTVKPWFNGRLDLSPPVPDLVADGFPLIGGRLEHLDERNAAALVYRRRQHVINLFVWPSPDAADRSVHSARHNGYTVLEWTKAGIGYAAVSDLNAEELSAFQRLWVAQAG